MVPTCRDRVRLRSTLPHLCPLSQKGEGNQVNHPTLKSRCVRFISLNIMKIVKPNKIGLKKAVEILKQGGVIVYPTDTAYAMGGIFDSKKVKEKILRIKKRKDKKFTLIASNLNQVEKNFKFSTLQKKLARKFWPGPLSIVVSPRFAVRVPKNKIAQDLAGRCKKPLIATSANISGTKTLYNSKEIIKQFKDKKNQPDLILAGGNLKKRKASTIVKVNSTRFQVIRPGEINFNQFTDLPRI